MDESFFGLLDKELLLRKFFDSIPFFLLDKDLRINYVNELVLNWLKKFNVDFINKKVSDLFYKKFDKQIQIIKTIFTTKSEIYLEEEFEISGKKLWISIKFYPLIKNNEVIGIIGFSRDITDRKKIENELKENVAKFKNILVSSPDAIIVSDLQGLVIECNDAILKLGNMNSKEELIGQNVFNFIVPSQQQKGYNNFQQLLNGSGPLRNVEYDLVYYDLHLQTEISSSLMLDDSGKPIYFISIIKDVSEQKLIKKKLEELNKELEAKVDARTKELKEVNLKLMEEIYIRKKAEENLAFEKERLFVTLKNIDVAVIAADISGKILLMNPVAEELLCIKFDIITELCIQEIFNIFTTDAKKKITNPLDKILIKKENIIYSKPVLLLDTKDKEHIITGSATPVIDNDKNIFGIVLAFRDITQQFIIEEELKKRQKIEFLELLSGGIAHDFNNILTIVLGNISFSKLNIDQDGESYKSLIEAEKAIKQARELTNQLLYFSKEGIPVKTTVAIDTLIKESVQFILRGSNISYSFDIAKDLFHAEADKSQISQVIQNIIINAKQAMEEGGALEIKCSNAVVKKNDLIALPEGDYIFISIKDNGKGIDKDKLEKIFEPYYSTKYNGTGLGLAIAYSIITKHNGIIKVESEKDIGSTFKIYLPAKVVFFEENESEKREIIIGKGKILIMDDEEMIRTFLSKALVKLGYEVILSKNGEEAINIFKDKFNSDQKIDLAILDLTIPGGFGGKEVVGEIKKIDKKVKVIASSGYSNDVIISRYESYGFDDIIPKPYDIEELSRKIYDLINKK